MSPIKRPPAPTKAPQADHQSASGLPACADTEAQERRAEAVLNEVLNGRQRDA